MSETKDLAALLEFGVREGHAVEGTDSLDLVLGFVESIAEALEARRESEEAAAEAAEESVSTHVHPGTVSAALESSEARERDYNAALDRVGLAFVRLQRGHR